MSSISQTLTGLQLCHSPPALSQSSSSVTVLQLCHSPPKSPKVPSSLPKPFHVSQVPNSFKILADSLIFWLEPSLFLISRSTKHWTAYLATVYLDSLINHTLDSLFRLFTGRYFPACTLEIMTSHEKKLCLTVISDFWEVRPLSRSSAVNALRLTPPALTLAAPEMSAKATFLQIDRLTYTPSKSPTWLIDSVDIICNALRACRISFFTY
jgi:hypothetical protein